MATSALGKRALPRGLTPKKLRHCVDPKSLGFETTATLAGKQELLGQERAVDAIKLSAQIDHKDFNLFVLGNEGTGRHSAIRKILSESATTRPPPSDWVYVNNFDAPDKPNAIKVPAGMAGTFRTAMQDVVDDLAHEIPALFESQEYQTQRRAIEEEFGQRHEAPIAEFAERVKKESVALLRTPMGFILAAAVDGKPITAEAFEALPDEERSKFEEKVARLQKELSAILKSAPQLEKEHRRRIEELHAAMAEGVVSLRIQEVVNRFSDTPIIVEHLARVREDMITNAELFLVADQNRTNGPFPDAIRKYHLESQFDRYAVNVMVSHSGDTEAAPIVYEDLPTLAHLTGRIEYVSEMGTLATNFTLIKPGALHSANGGYLILDAHRVLSEPFAWDALKRCLQSRSITMTSLAERMSLASTITLEPDPIPVDVRVVLIGDRWVYMLLALLDPEFCELFKVQADFEDDLPRSADSTRRLARIIGSYAAKENLPPLTAAAVAAMLDHAVRLADDAKKFTLRIGALIDILREAGHYALQAKHGTISDKDIKKAIHQTERRASRIKDRMKEAIYRKTILIDTSGEVEGQVNGLSVLGIGTYRFGRPSRITARVRMGTGKLVDIEREVELGGPLHSKGVLILGAYLASRYALDAPMSLHASLVFEQSYGGVDGDSASSAELYALLSALAAVPIRQGLAVTGSVNQNGEVQAIGGVNEKIEGFFDVCKARRLTGFQGVLIPKSNIDHLMLRQDVVDAAAVGEFRIIPVATIDQGIEILTGVSAGRRHRSGAFPPNSINGRVETCLREYAAARHRFGKMDEVEDKAETRS